MTLLVSGDRKQHQSPIYQTFTPQMWLRLRHQLGYHGIRSGIRQKCRLNFKRHWRKFTVIVFELGCENHHRFEGWFASSGDFDRQLGDKLLVCPLCGNGKITRLPHASHVSTGGSSRPESAKRKTTEGVPQQYTNLGGEMLARLIDHVIENTEDVGQAFPDEARKIHYQEAPERHIRGTASPREIEALREEGVDVIALPLPPHRLVKTH